MADTAPTRREIDDLLARLPTIAEELTAIAARLSATRRPAADACCLSLGFEDLEAARRRGMSCFGGCVRDRLTAERGA